MRIASGVSGHIHPAFVQVEAWGRSSAFSGSRTSKTSALRDHTDGGKTWSEPVPFGAGRRRVVVINDSLTTLAGGRIVHLLESLVQAFRAVRAAAHRYSISTDDGVTWSEARVAEATATRSRRGIRSSNWKRLVARIGRRRRACSFIRRPAPPNPHTGRPAHR